MHVCMGTSAHMRGRGGTADLMGSAAEKRGGLKKKELKGRKARSRRMEMREGGRLRNKRG